MTAQTAIFVLGMHRSGTSALSRVLNLLGADLPRHVLPPGVGNEAGHWEPEPAIALNEAVLAAAGASVEGLSGPADAWFATDAAQAFVAPMQALIQAEFGEAPLFVFKDPRSALVFPLWRRALDRLGVRCAAVVITRDPVEVARSLAERAARNEPWKAWPIDRGGLLWLRYTLAAERHSRGGARAFLTYDELLADWEGATGRVGRELGIGWPRPPMEAAMDIGQFLDPRHRHQRAGQPLAPRGGIWASWVAPAVAALRDGPEPSALDAIARSFADTCAALVTGTAAGAARLPDVTTILAVAAVEAASLSATCREAELRAEVLATMLTARTEAAQTAERYAQSLEKALAETRAARDEAAEYARSLEQARERAETYARQLEAQLSKASGSSATTC